MGYCLYVEKVWKYLTYNVCILYRIKVTGVMLSLTECSIYINTVFTRQNAEK